MPPSNTANAYALLSKKTGSERFNPMRIRYQLPALLLVAVGVPFFIRYLLDPRILSDDAAVSTVVLAGSGVIASFFVWRRLHLFPGTSPAGAAIWSVLMVFATIAAYVILSRVDYSRTIIFVAPAVTFVWLLALSVVTSRMASIRFGVLPGGHTGNLPRTKQIEWVELDSPSDPSACDGYVADLRHDHDVEWEKQIVEWTLRGVPVYHTKQIIEHLTGRISIDHLSENSFGSVLPNLNYLVGKRIIDVLAIAVFFVPIALVSLVISLLILLADGRPVLYKQTRVGFRGKAFRIYKFRTMRDLPKDSVPKQKAELTLDNDPRIFPVARFLRKYRLDELPQLINVARGEMSWIGPRPEAEALARHYEATFPFYRYRYAVRPGITGWAQVSQGHVIDDNDIRVKLEYDFYYVKNVSFWLDLTTALKTLRVVLRGHGGK